MDPYLTFDIRLGPILDIGKTPSGHRRMVPILGGSVTGAFEARVVLGGADWQIVLPNGTAEINARYVLETPREERIEVQSVGIRACPEEIRIRLERGEDVPAESYYFRTAVRLFTAAPAFMSLNDRLFSGRGQRSARSVKLFINQIP